MELEMFITEFTRAYHCSLSRCIQFIPSHPISLKIHFNIILPFVPRSSEWSHHFGVLDINFYTLVISPIRATWPAHFILRDFITLILFSEGYKLCIFFESSASASLLGPHILFSALVFKHSQSLKSSVFITTAVRFSNPTFPTCVHPVMPEEQNMCDRIYVHCSHRIKLISVIQIRFFESGSRRTQVGCRPRPPRFLRNLPLKFRYFSDITFHVLYCKDVH
jgi:hypothetical protein